MAEVAVVGGGVVGLTLALRWAEAGHRVTLLEGAAQPGGLAAPHLVGDVTWDRFYHVILESDRALLGLIDALGLRDRVQWGTTRTGFYTDGRFHSLSTSLDFLRFPPLSLFDKARLAATIVRASRIQDGEALEAETVEAWLVRWSGRRTFERIWRPLLEAKLGTNWRRVSAAFIWAIIARMYAARRSGLKRERFGHLAGGYATLLTSMRQALESRGVVLRTGAFVERLQRAGSRVRVECAGAPALLADHAVLTIPTTRIAALLPELADEERERYARVQYQGVICASVLLDRPLGGYYVTNITDPGFPFTTVIEMSALVPPSTFGGLTLAYLPRYCPADDAWWGRSDDEIGAELLGGLRRLYPDLPTQAVRHIVISRAREVQALPTLHYRRDAVPPRTTSLGTVHVVNSAQILNGTLNANEGVALAEAAARDLSTLFGTP
ncbi:MAG: NAD(P)/FAD-dependent oxidoreductase [Gemmatimonadaceae bacterium]